MMKKLLLSLVAGGFALSAFAQQNANNSIVLKNSLGQYKAMPDPNDAGYVKSHANTPANKTTATGGSQWFIPFDMINSVYLGGSLDNNTFVFPIGWDSTQTQFFQNPTPKYYPVNWLSVAEFVDPIYSQGFKSTDYSGDNGLYVLPGSTYTVDSVFFQGAYVANPTRPATVVDTFVVSVAAVPYSLTSINKTSYPAITNYEGVTDNGNVLKIEADLNATSGARTLNYAGVKSWKVPIDTSKRHVKTANGYTTNGFTYAVPGGLNVGTNSGFAVSVAFKPGEPYSGDSVAAHNYFMPLAGYGTSGQVEPYFFYTYNDRNMSYLMHYSADNRYSSTLQFELWNTPDLSYEFFPIGGYVTCNSCWDLSVANVSNIASVAAYPNPATSEVTVPFTLKNAANVTISLTNTMGQVITSQSFGKTNSGKATFNTASLANGLYFYTIVADGAQKTGRVVVAH